MHIIMIKAVIFDIGGVISTTILRRMAQDLAKKHNLDEETLAKQIHTGWTDYKTGKINAAEFWQEFLHESKISENIDELEKDSISYIKEIQGVADIAKSLKQKYRTAVLSNTVESWMQKFREMFDTESMFDLIISSHEIAMCKPNKNFFDYCLEKLGLNAEDCIFIDDQNNNIDAAKNFGFKTIKFENAEQLKSELKNLGVEL